MLTCTLSSGVTTVRLGDSCLENGTDPKKPIRNAYECTKVISETGLAAEAHSSTPMPFIGGNFGLSIAI